MNTEYMIEMLNEIADRLEMAQKEVKIGSMKKAVNGVIVGIAGTIEDLLDIEGDGHELT
jgi:hypothetical protein